MLLLIISLFLTSTLSVKLACSGNGFTYYVMENGETKRYSSTSPTSSVPFPMFRSPISIDCGDDHVCVITNTSQVYCWGNNTSGQIGSALPTPVLTPTLVSSLAFAPSEIRTGIDFTCCRQGTTYNQCWGNNADGQLGIGSTTSTSSPTLASQACSWLKLELGGYHSYASCSSGIYSWGKNNAGQLGINSTLNKGGSPANFPLASIGLSSVREISTGFYHTCFLFNNGSYACTGNGYGLIPMIGGGSVLFNTLYSYQNRTCGIASNGGSVYCWDTTNQIPVVVAGFNPYSNKTWVAGVAATQLCILGIDPTHSLMAKRLICWNETTGLIIVINPACGDGVVDTSEGEQCEPPSTSSCDLNCKVIITSPPTTPISTLPLTLPLTTNPISSSSTFSSIPQTTLQQLTPSPSGSSSQPPLQILGAIVVRGNFTVTTLIIGANTSIDVRGCANIDGELTVLSLNSSSPFLTADCVNGSFGSVSLLGEECREGVTRKEADKGRLSMYVQSNCNKGSFPFWVIGIIVGFFVLAVVVVVSYALYRAQSYSRNGVVFHRMTGEDSL